MSDKTSNLEDIRPDDSGVWNLAEGIYEITIDGKNIEIDLPAYRQARLSQSDAGWELLFGTPSVSHGALRTGDRGRIESVSRKKR